MIYKLQLSSGKETIQISEAELEKFKQNVGANFIEFENGIINPSFVVCILIDVEATREQNRQLRAAERLYIPEPKEDLRGTPQMKEMLEKYRPTHLLKESEE